MSTTPTAPTAPTAAPRGDRAARRPADRRAPARGLAGVAAALALLLTGCAGAAEPGADPGAEPSASPAPEESPGGATSSPDQDPAPAPDVDVQRYVAIGDSYTAAPYVPDTETESGCLRSSGNYPSLVAEAIDVGELVDVSCVGADGTAMIGAQPTINGQVNLPQFEALDRRTDLVTVGLGGNDFGVFSRLVGGCVQRADEDPDGSPCRDAQQVGGRDQLLGDLRRTEERLTSVLRGVRDRSPRAQVLVVGYPVLVPDEGACPDRLPLAEDDYPYVRRVNQALNDALRGAARASGTTYVDVGRASAGHDICSDDPWVNGAQTDEEQALAFHPFPAGQEAVAGLVLAALEEGGARA